MNTSILIIGVLNVAVSEFCCSKNLNMLDLVGFFFLLIFKNIDDKEFT